MSRARVVGQDVPYPTFPVALADPPDGRAVARQAAGDFADALPGGNGQDDPGVLDLKPSQAAVVRDELQDRNVRFREGQRTRRSTTHEHASTTGYPQHNR
jgi:hypothetical protein